LLNFSPRRCVLQLSDASLVSGVHPAGATFGRASDGTHAEEGRAPTSRRPGAFSPSRRRRGPSRLPAKGTAS